MAGEETIDQQKDLLSKPIFKTTKLSIAQLRQDENMEGVTK